MLIMCWSMGPGPPVLTLMLMFEIHDAQSVPTLPVHVPEMRIMSRTVLRIDTGGERWVLKTPLKQGGFAHSGQE